MFYNFKKVEKKWSWWWEAWKIWKKRNLTEENSETKNIKDEINSILNTVEDHEVKKTAIVTIQNKVQIGKNTEKKWIISSGLKLV